MLQANFYQLQTAPIKSAFPKLLENLFTKEKTVQIVCTNDAEVEYYDMLIWTYSQLSFIPHNTYKDKYIVRGLVRARSEVVIKNSIINNYEYICRRFGPHCGPSSGLQTKRRNNM